MNMLRAIWGSSSGAADEDVAAKPGEPRSLLEPERGQRASPAPAGDAPVGPAHQAPRDSPPDLSSASGYRQPSYPGAASAAAAGAASDDPLEQCVDPDVLSDAGMGKIAAALLLEQDPARADECLRALGAGIDLLLRAKRLGTCGRWGMAIRAISPLLRTSLRLVATSTHSLYPPPLSLPRLQRRARPKRRRWDTALGCTSRVQSA